MSYKPIALNNISCSLLYHYDDKDDVYSIGNIEKDKYIEVKESNKDVILYVISQLNGKNTIDEVEQLVREKLNCKINVQELVTILEKAALLEGAGEKLGEELAKVEIHKPQIPYVCNVDASYVTEAEPVKELLTKQVSHSVCWMQSVDKMIADGVDTFIEIGPGKALSGFVKRINRKVKTFNIDSAETFRKTVDSLRNLD